MKYHTTRPTPALPGLEDDFRIVHFCSYFHVVDGPRQQFDLPRKITLSLSSAVAEGSVEGRSRVSLVILEPHLSGTPIPHSSMLTDEVNSQQDGLADLCYHKILHQLPSADLALDFHLAMDSYGVPANSHDPSSEWAALQPIVRQLPLHHLSTQEANLGARIVRSTYGDFPSAMYHPDVNLQPFSTAEIDGDLL